MARVYEIIDIEGNDIDNMSISWLIETFNYYPKDISTFIIFCNSKIEELSNKVMALKRDIFEIKYDIIRNMDKYNNLEDLLNHLKLKIEIYENHYLCNYNIELDEYYLEKFQNLKIFLQKYNNQLYYGEIISY